MYKNIALIALIIINASGCASFSQKAEAKFESFIRTDGYYYSEGNSEQTKIIEEQLANHNINKEVLKSLLGEKQYYALTFDDLSSNRLTYITLSNPVVDGEIDEKAIKKKVSSQYRVSEGQDGGYIIRFYENSGNMNSDFLIRANSKGEIKNFTFFAQ